MSEIVLNILNDILKTEGIEEAFVCFIVHRPSTENDKQVHWQHELSNAFNSLSPEQTEAALCQYLSIASTASYSTLQLLMSLLEKLSRGGAIAPRLLCETLITFDKLQYQNEDFWLESLKLLRKLIDLVEYKGVREIMKVCKKLTVFFA